MGDVFDAASGDVFDQIQPRSQASPIPPPGMPPSHLDMHESYVLGGEPKEDISHTLGEMGKGAIRSAVQVTAPGIAASFLKEHGAKFPDVIDRNLAPTKELPADIMVNALPMMFGADALPKSDMVVEAPRPTALSSGVGSRMLEVAKRRAGHIPGVQAVKDTNYVLRGSGSTPRADMVVQPPPAPIPETDGIQWGTGGTSPLDMRGKMLPEVLPPQMAGPEKPPPEVLRASPLQQGGKVAPPEPSEALGKIPVSPPEEAVPAAIPKAVASKTLDRTLRDAVGNNPVRPGVTMRDQFTVKPVGGDIPEGHTPAESTAVKSFKYDPAAKELHVTTSNGMTYVSGEVTPAQAEAFRTAASKGQAWKAIRDNSPLVAKIPAGGKRIASRPSGFRSVSPDDLTPELEKSVEEAKKRKMANTEHLPRGLVR